MRIPLPIDEVDPLPTVLRPVHHAARAVDPLYARHMPERVRRLFAGEPDEDGWFHHPGCMGPPKVPAGQCLEVVFRMGMWDVGRPGDWEPERWWHTDEDAGHHITLYRFVDARVLGDGPEDAPGNGLDDE